MGTTQSRAPEGGGWVCAANHEPGHPPPPPPARSHAYLADQSGPRVARGGPAHIHTGSRGSGQAA